VLAGRVGRLCHEPSSHDTWASAPDER